MIRVNAFFQINAGAHSEFMSTVKTLVAASQAEEGCVAYDIFQSQTREDVFIICETWKSAEALELHAATEHFTTAIAALESLCTSKIEKFEM